MITKLLTPNTKQRRHPMIQIIDNQEKNDAKPEQSNEDHVNDEANEDHVNDGANDDDVNDDEANQEEYDWHINQVERKESDELLLYGEKYGFANQQTGIFSRLAEDVMELIDLKDPEQKNLSMRRKERIESEQKSFSDDHYLYDFYEQNEIISNLITLQMPWDQMSESDVISFSDDEIFKLKNLPKRDYSCIHDKETKKSLLLGMIDILFSYAYNKRVTEGENCVESGWNISKLSSTLSFFESFTLLHDVIIANLRRSLCYPLFRHWSLSIKVHQDVIKIIRIGRKFILKCFLEIHSIFNESGDSRYILNDLYITDYCVWIQHQKQSTFESLVKALEKIQVSKSDVDLDLDLDLLEKAACMAIEEKCSQINSQTLKSHSTTKDATNGTQSDHVRKITERHLIDKKAADKNKHDFQRTSKKSLEINASSVRDSVSDKECNQNDESDEYRSESIDSDDDD